MNFVNLQKNDGARRVVRLLQLEFLAAVLQGASGGAEHGDGRRHLVRGAERGGIGRAEHQQTAGRHLDVGGEGIVEPNQAPRVPGPGRIVKLHRLGRDVLKFHELFTARRRMVMDLVDHHWPDARPGI